LALVRAIDPFPVDVGDGRHLIITKEDVLQDTHPFVRAHPELFTPVVPTIEVPDDGETRDKPPRRR
jgi:hypothetical protein